MRRLIIIAALAALVLPASAGAVRLGVEGDKGRFRSQTGQNSHIHMVFTSWGVRAEYLDKVFTRYTPVPMVAFGTATQGGREAFSPRSLARGYGDTFLIRVSRAASRYGREAYIRPLAEMNGHWNFYSAYNSNGSYRGDAHSTKNFRRTFRRIYLIMHGGQLSEINPKLRSLGMPALRTSSDLPSNSLVRVVWNPQGFGSPDLRGNRANSYYPGDRYVDVVANDLYNRGYRAEWDANLALFKSHPSKPYAIGEWGLWGIDDPAFVKRMANFVSTHPRVEAIVYYRSKPGGLFDLGSKPKSRAAYRRYIVPLGD